MIVIVMGAAGAGKTSVGRRLAASLGWPFHDADDFHPAANVDKMRRGAPLTDADRDPWLAALARLTREVEQADGRAVLACSALRRRYRDRLRAGTGDDAVRFLYLRAPAELLEQRLHERRGHFMPATLIASQLETLEEPAPDEGALVLDASQPVEELVRCARDWIQQRGGEAP